MAPPLHIPYLDGSSNSSYVASPRPPCTETDGDLVGLGFRLGLYMLASSFLIIYVRGAKGAAAGQSQITMISYFAVFITLYSHGMSAVTDKEFVSITYLLGLFSVVASLDFHLYLAHGTIKPSDPQHRLYFVFRFILISITSILTYALQLAFWSTYFREMACGDDSTSAFLFAQLPAYGAFRVLALFAICLLFLYNVLAAAYTAYRLFTDFGTFVKGAQANAKEAEEGTYWDSLGEVSSRHFSQLMYGVQRLVIVVFMIIGAELTIKWNKVPFIGDVYSLGQILFLMLGMFSMIQSMVMPVDSNS
jgi:hypothetical protein